MKLKVNRFSIQIIPESEIEEAYIENVLGLKDAGDFVELTRINVMDFSGIAYLEAKERPEAQRKK